MEQGTETREALRERLKLLPDLPGVYLFKNEAGEIIYVGKAVSLRNRVRSYFQKASNLSPKVRTLVRSVADFEYIVTNTEVEALILEATLVKQHKPRYNARLKDDKAYPYIKVVNEPYPRVMVVRRVLKDGSRYFGPYTNVKGMRDTLKFLRKLFPLRTCNLDLSGPLDYRPCLLYHIERCIGPCAGKCTPEAYNELIEQVCLFLEGRHEQIIPSLRRKMEEAAERLEFEKAARLRDQVRALESVVERQKVVSHRGGDQDVIGYAVEGGLACVQVFFVREGKLIGRDHFLMELGDLAREAAAAGGERGKERGKGRGLSAGAGLNGAGGPGEGADGEGTDPAEAAGSGDDDPGDEGPVAGGGPAESGILEAFLSQYYAEAAFIPREILLPEPVEDPRLIESWLRERRQGPVYLRVPKRGDKRRLVEMVTENAALVLKEELAKSAREDEDAERAMRQLQEILELPTLPERIEAFDISNLHGNQAVASMVVAERGRPKNQDYRRFRIRTKDTPDDFAMMYEAVRRRFLRALREQDDPNEPTTSFSVMPDLVIIDGGKGQLGAALQAMRELGVDEVPVIALAKRFEHVFVEGRSDPIILPPGSPALHLLQRIRDEAHRFALNYHRKLRDRETTRSVLDKIPGIGPRRKKALIQRFGSVRRIAEATLEELQSVPGLPPQVALRLYESLQAERPNL